MNSQMKKGLNNEFKIRK